VVRDVYTYHEASLDNLPSEPTPSCSKLRTAADDLECCSSPSKISQKSVPPLFNMIHLAASRHLKIFARRVRIDDVDASGHGACPARMIQRHPSPRVDHTVLYMREQTPAPPRALVASTRAAASFAAALDNQYGCVRAGAHWLLVGVDAKALCADTRAVLHARTFERPLASNGAAKRKGARHPCSLIALDICS